MRSFRGGVHPADHKSDTCEKPIVDLIPPKELVCPLSQHIGKPAIPCVKTGDSVLMGQKIAEADGFVSANLHAPVSGKVKTVEKRLHPNGAMVDAIVIENDFEDRMDPSVLDQPVDYHNLSKEEILARIREAGIVGMGGATFPTHVKLSPPAEAKIEYVIVNGSECEPYLTSDHRVMLESPEEVLDGLCIVLQIFGLQCGYVGIEDNKPAAIERMKEAAAKYQSLKIHIVPLKTKYPQGAEKQLIDAVSGRKVKPGQLPWQSGCIVLNIDTAASVMRAVTMKMPLVQRIVTLGGDALKHPMNYRVRIGTPFSYVIAQSGGTTETPRKILMGGPMMGTAVPDPDVPVIKGSSGILALGEKAARLAKESACIRCAKCVYVCPMQLQPNLLDLKARLNDYDALDKLHIFDCIECGSCAFVCPSKRRQVQQIKVAKGKMRAMQTKQGGK